MLYAIIAAIILIVDQWFKYWVTINITLDTGEQALIPSVVKLVNIHNDGAAFGILSNMRWLFVAIAVVFVAALLILMIKKVFTGGFVRWCAVLAMTGAIGNCIDRVLYGYVVDMFKLEFVNFAVFNIADIVLVVSCLLFIIFLLVGDSEEDEEEEDYAEPVSDGKVAVAELDSRKVEAGAKAKRIAGDDVRGAAKAKLATDDDFWASFTSSAKQPEAAPAEKPASKPAAPAAEPAAEPVFDTETDEFDLESILNEFR